MRPVMRAMGTLLDLLLPPACMGCDNPTDGPFQLCATCFGQWHLLVDPLCSSCGVPFAYAAQRGPGGRCPGCIARPPRYHQARAALAYRGQAKPLILAFKYANRIELADLFAPVMARAAAAQLTGADWLVPVPLHRARLRHRGYNQAALLARALSRLRGIPCLPDALQRTRRTESLGVYDVQARAEIMATAISTRPHRADLLAGRHIVVVDDVMTSGATMNACAAALLDAGASRVDAVLAARVPDPRLDS